MNANLSNLSLQTIADQAGVSRAAVSLALRNQPGVSDVTRDRIKQIAKEAGYRPNPMVSALMAHLKSLRPRPDSGSIPFLTAFSTRHGWQEYPTFTRYYAGASERAQQAGYRLEEMWMREPGMTTKKMRSILVNRGVEGILVAPVPKGMGHISLDVSPFAVATLGHSVIRPDFHRAAGHQTESLRLATHNLRRMGYCRIGFALSEMQDRRNNYSWGMAYAGYQQARPSKDLIPPFYLDRTSDAQFADWLKKWNPDVILSGNAEILPKLAKAGLRVPADVGVAILDRSPSDTRIAGIDQQMEQVGASAMDLIIGQLHRNERGIPKNPKLILTQGVWVMGETLRKSNPKTAVPTSIKAKPIATKQRTRIPRQSRNMARAALS